MENQDQAFKSQPMRANQLRLAALPDLAGIMKSVESNAKNSETDSKLPPRWKGFAREVLKQVCVVYLILKNPKSPLLAKMVAGLTVGYVFSPIQLIPSFIPVIGWMDDVAVVSVGLRIL